MPRTVEATSLEPAWKIAPSANSSGPAPSRTGRPLEIEDIFALKLAGEPATRPDGTSVAVAVEHIDREANEYRAAIWLFPLDGSEPRQLTTGRWRDGVPVWSPDGQHLAFSSKRDDDKPQIWVLPVDGGEARRATSVPNGAASPVWSPDSQKIAFTSTVDPEGFDPDRDVRVITGYRYKFDGKGFLDDKRSHLFVVDAFREGAEAMQLTDGNFDHESPAWSPSGKEIGFLANRNNDWQVSRTRDLWTVPASGGEPRQLTDGAGIWMGFAWSPDGSQIALHGIADAASAGTKMSRLYTMPAAGGELTRIASDLDRQIGDGSMSGPNGPNSGRVVRWTPEGSAVDALVSDRGSTLVVRFDLEKNTQTVLTGRDRHVTAFDHVDRGEGLVIAVTDPTSPASLRVVRANGESQLSTFNDAWSAEVGLASPEEFWIEVNGRQVQGWLHRPAGNSSTSAKVPLILNIHGGPFAQFSPAFSHELQMYAARGYALAFINPRGSVGQDEAFADMITAKWGEADAPDFLAAIEHVIGLGGIDENRIGVTGGSYGGFSTNYLLGTTNRFKAAVTDRSICNMVSMFGTDDIGLTSLKKELGTPWENTERYWELSPLKYVGNVTAPCLIIHSENDYRCPMEQAEQWFTALTSLGVPTELVRFQNESHGLSRNGGPKHRVERLERTIGWFDRYL